MNENNHQIKALLTVKNLIRLLALFALIFVFCPSFLVSCSGQTVDVSVIDAVKGVDGFEDPHPLLIVCILIPLGILALTFIKKWTIQKRAQIMGGLSLVDVIFWIIFRIGVSHFAEDNYLTFETTPWYIIALIFLVLMSIVTLLVAFNKLEINKNILSLVEERSGHPHLDSDGQEISDSYQHKKIIGYCNQCGEPIEEDFMFCTTCGSKAENLDSPIMNKTEISHEDENEVIESDNTK